MKVSVSEAEGSHETGILQLISSFAADTHTGRENIVQLRDSFWVEGPNGKHQCLVLELLGPSISDIADVYLRDYRLPAQAARSIARQVFEGADFLARLNIGHGGKSLAITHHFDSRITDATAKISTHEI